MRARAAAPAQARVATPRANAAHARRPSSGARTAHPAHQISRAKQCTLTLMRTAVLLMAAHTMCTPQRPGRSAIKYILGTHNSTPIPNTSSPTPNTSAHSRAPTQSTKPGTHATSIPHMPLGTPSGDNHRGNPRHKRTINETYDEPIMRAERNRSRKRSAKRGDDPLTRGHCTAELTRPPPAAGKAAFGDLWRPLPSSCFSFSSTPCSLCCLF